MTTPAYPPDRTALLIVDPYNDFLPDGRRTSIDLALHTCIRVTRFRPRPAGSFAWEPTLCSYLLIQRISRVSPATGGTAHTSYICPAPITPINGFWLYRLMKLISSEGGERQMRSSRSPSTGPCKVRLEQDGRSYCPKFVRQTESLPYRERNGDL